MKLKAFLPLSLIVLLLACSPATKLVNTWVDPALTSETVKPFKNVLVIASIKDETRTG